MPNNNKAIIDECKNNKQKIYATYIHGNFCVVFNNIKEDSDFIFEYRSTRIKLKNYKSFIMNIKINYLKVTDINGKTITIEGLKNEDAKYLPISENGSADILMCFAANDPEDTLCINDPNVYANLPDEEIDVLKSVVNEPMLKYRKLIFNLTFETIEKGKEPFTYDIIINWTLNGFDSRTNYIP